MSFYPVLNARILLESCLVLAVLLVTSNASAQPAAGGPPVYPIERIEPKLCEATIDAGIFAERQVINEQAPLLSQRSEVLVPIILQGAYSKVDPSSITVSGNINGQVFSDGQVPWTIRGPRPDGSAEIVVELIDLQAQSVGVKVTWTEQTWLPLINEVDALRTTWPKEWPEATRTYLKPSPWIQSDDQFLIDFVARVSKGNLRGVSPYAAAKELVRESVLAYKSISGTGNERREFGQISGLQLIGASESARSATGSPNDMVCTCVAILRAAGIPARPVVGIMKELTKDLKERTQWRTWAEFYLPKAGWVPFDPNLMRGSGFQFRGLEQAWTGFANIKDFNDRIPVAYRFQPEGSLWNWPPVWGFIYGGDLQRARKIYSQTSLMRIGRGAGIPDA
ncbi:MAG: transglutaminase domain-containing protein [Phycisphaerales bacterium]|jgi:hypothetical protein|nr:transglutaminase domain-containing protein [Phycisphaerales bacterium]